MVLREIVLEREGRIGSIDAIGKIRGSHPQMSCKCVDESVAEPASAWSFIFFTQYKLVKIVLQTLGSMSTQ